MLEFETVYWGEWAPPHTPNKEVDIDGGSDGLAAKDDAAGVIVFATATDTPFFGLRLAAINISSGKVSTVGNNWPYPPTDFPGIYGLFHAVEQAPSLGFVVLITQISKFGPVPTRSPIPGTPLGWTVAVAVDPATGNSTALSEDMTPALSPFPPLVSGLSALDPSTSMLWLFSAGDAANPLGPQGCPNSTAQRAAIPRFRSTTGRKAANRGFPSMAPPPSAATTPTESTTAFFLGFPLSRAQHPPPPAAAPPPTPIPIQAGSIVTAFEYASAVDALIALSYNPNGSSPPLWKYPSAVITLYPVNGTTPVVLGEIAANTYSPLESIGASQVSADGRYVYFGAVQPSNTFESAALITVDTLARTITNTNAAPTDDYDVYNLFRC